MRIIVHIWPVSCNETVLENYAFLVYVYYTHPGYQTSICGKNRAYYIQILTVISWIQTQHWVLPVFRPSQPTWTMSLPFLAPRKSFDILALYKSDYYYYYYYYSLHTMWPCSMARCETDTHFTIPWRWKAWCYLGTAVRVCILGPRLNTAVAFLINTLAHCVIWCWVSHSTVWQFMFLFNVTRIVFFYISRSYLGIMESWDFSVHSLCGNSSQSGRACLSRQIC